MKGRLREGTMREWDREWQEHPSCRQTRHFFPSMRPRMSYDLMKTDRKVFGLLVQVLTGHNYMRQHQDVIDSANGDETEDPTCTLCGDGNMSSQHIIGECGALAHLRQKYFSAQFLIPPFTSLSKGSLVGFLREAPIDELQFFLEDV